MNKLTMYRYLVPLMGKLNRLCNESSRYAEISVKITKHDGDIRDVQIGVIDRYRSLEDVEFDPAEIFPENKRGPNSRASLNVEAL